MDLTGIDDRVFHRVLAHRGSRRADGGRQVLPGLMLAVSFMLALAAGVALASAEARDLLILRTELRHGALLSCDATACRLDGSTHEHGERPSLTESVSWELTRASAPCDAPPRPPPIPAEREPPDEAEP